MSRTLDDALNYASKRGTQLTEWALKAPPPPTSNIQPAAPPVGGLNQLSRQQQGLMHATEQYRHFSGWVYSAIRPIAQRIAGQPIRLARKRKRGQRGQRAHKDTIPRNLRSIGDLELIDSHPLLDTLHDPNAVMVRWVLMYVTVCSLELTGKAFLWMRPRSAAEADYPGQWEIWPIPTSWVLPIHEQGRLYAGWAVRPNDAAEAVIVPAEQMGYLYYPDPADPLNAVAPLQAVGRAVASDEALQEGQRRGFLNGLNPGVLITIGRHPDVQGMPGQRPILTKTQRDQIVAAIKAYYRGVTHHDEPLILDGMIENATKLTNTPREMDYLNSGKMTKERISQGFGTNPIVMGQIEGANRASASTADEHFCFLPGTQVVARRGVVPIETVDHGDALLTGDGSFVSVVKPLTRIFSGNLSVLHIAGMSRSCEVTPDHPMWIERNGQQQWMAAGQILRGDRVGMPGSRPTQPSDIVRFDVGSVVNRNGLVASALRKIGTTTRWLPEAIVADVPFAWMLGMYVAEGCSSYTSGITFSLHEDEEEEVVARIAPVLEQLGASRANSQQNGSRSVQVHFRHPTLGDWLDLTCGKGARQKKVPWFVFNWPSELQNAFLAGYLYGDGCVSGRTVSFVTASCSLAHGMQTLLSMAGFPCSLSNYHSKEHLLAGRVLAAGEFWTGRVSSGSVALAALLDITVGPAKKASRNTFRHDGRYCWHPVMAVETVPYDGPVHNVHLERDHNYVSEFGIASNCSTTVNPKIELISECLTAWLGPLFAKPGEELVLYVEPATTYDPERHLEEMKFLREGGALTINESRIALGWPAIDGGDVVFVPNGMTPVPIGGPPTTEPPADPPSDPPADDE
jgi:phage portal protein BeeE